MNAQEARVYSATKIMGWRCEGTDDYFGLPTEFCAPEFQWHPDQNRDQLWLVLEKWFAWYKSLPARKGTTKKRKEVAQLIGTMLCYHHDISATIGVVLQHAMSDPELTLIAICTAHQAQTEGDL